MDQVHALFAIPLLRAPATLPAELVRGLVAQFSAIAVRDNNTSPRLAHTEMLQPADHPLLAAAAGLVAPKLVEFGAVLFGERLDWAIKEIWVNVLETGGHQAMHNHANSFVSGVVYLTETDATACTVFMKAPGGTDFVFKNDHAVIQRGPFNADRWVSPQPAPGDLVLFPSYLLHAVPPNAGPRRITLSFNAVPARLESWGYAVRFSA